MVFAFILFLISCEFFQHAHGASKNCENSTGLLEECVWEKLRNDTVAKKMEEEFFNDSLSLVKQCFDKADTKIKRNCVLEPIELQMDAFGSKGPLRDCLECQKVAKDLRSMYFLSALDQRRCLQNHLIKAISDQITPCVKNISKGSNMAAIMDFANSTFKFKDIELRTLNIQLLISDRLDMCSIVNSNRSGNTKHCLAHPSDKLFKDHCSTINQCKAKNTSRQCQDQATQTYKASCDCYKKHQDEWRNKGQEIHTAIFNTTNSDECYRLISKAFGFWKDRFESAVAACVRTDKPLTTMDKMIEIGCVQAQSMDDVEKRGLQSGFRFLRNFLGAVSDHAMRFCQNC